VAETYTHGHHESVLRSHRWRTAENSAAYLLPHLTAGQDLLDVGCGPGTITIDLAARLAPGRVVGIDAVEAPLAAARDAAREAGIDNVTFEIGDAYALAFEPGSFDVVHAHQVLQHLANPVAALREMARVCRDGGLVAARDSDYAAMTWFPADSRLDRWAELYDQVARRNGGEPDAGRRLLAWAHAAGFSDVTPSASVWCFATPADRAWWGGLWADRVTSSAFGEQAVAHGLTDTAELAIIAGAWQAWANEPDGWFIVPSGEVVCRRAPILGA
jgi:SAM-dependent methyltransferase